MIELRRKNILVVGMERSGIAAAILLLREGARVTAADQKPFEQLSEAARALRDEGVAFQTQQDGGFEKFDAIVLSPGVPADIPEVEAARSKGVPVLGEVELAAPFLSGPVIGITGSNGKTTTTALTGHILKNCGIPVQVGGNIGTPVTAMLDTSRAEQWNVLELSSFQLETVDTFHPNIAVILNITQNHLDRHGTMQRYAAAKARILDRQTSSDHAILNADDAFCREFAQRGAAQRLWFSSTQRIPDGLCLDQGHILFDGQRVIAAADVPIRGRHNLENTMAAIGAAALAGASNKPIAAAIKTFHAVEHRLEFVRSLDGVDFYNDSKATSVDATLKALDAFDHGVWIILGGKDKGSDYTLLRAPLEAKARAALLIGAAASKIAPALDGAVPLIESGTLDAAVQTAFAQAQPGDTILLAPACSSFDQFQSYEHRGQVFKELVRALESKTHGTAA
jgi:UDP-N-acetylmuramoylalanine--D-glutamate ligase